MRCYCFSKSCTTRLRILSGRYAAAGVPQADEQADDPYRADRQYDTGHKQPEKPYPDRVEDSGIFQQAVRDGDVRVQQPRIFPADRAAPDFVDESRAAVGQSHDVADDPQERSRAGQSEHGHQRLQRDGQQVEQPELLQDALEDVQRDDDDPDFQRQRQDGFQPQQSRFCPGFGRYSGRGQKQPARHVFGQNQVHQGRGDESHADPQQGHLQSGGSRFVLDGRFDNQAVADQCHDRQDDYAPVIEAERGDDGHRGVVVRQCGGQEYESAVAGQSDQSEQRGDPFRDPADYAEVLQYRDGQRDRDDHFDYPYGCPPGGSHGFAYGAQQADSE